MHTHVDMAMDLQSFKSIDESNAFIEQYMQEENNRPRDDFLGLSSAQLLRMHRADSLGCLAIS